MVDNCMWNTGFLPVMPVSVVWWGL